LAILDGDPAGRIEGRENFRAWMQDLPIAPSRSCTSTHFDVPESARRIEAMIAPVDGGGIYYTEPTEDGSRAGRIWWSMPAGLDTFSHLEGGSRNVYHEGVPGHHLERSQTMAERENLNRWQRLICAGVSGHGEGWATYAEPADGRARLPG